MLACVGGLFYAISKTNQDTTPTQKQYKKLLAAATHLVSISEEAERQEPYLVDLEAALVRIRRMREQLEPQREACEKYFKDAEKNSEGQRDIEEMCRRFSRMCAPRKMVKAMQDPNCARELKPAWIVIYRAMYGCDSSMRDHLFRRIEETPILTYFDPNDPNDESLWANLKRFTEQVVEWLEPDVEKELEEHNAPQWLAQYLGQSGFLHEWETGIGIAFSLWRPQSVVRARERMQEAIAQMDKICPQWRQMQAALAGENASQEASILERAYEKMNSFTKKEDILQALLDQQDRIEDFYVDFDLQESKESQDGHILWSMPERITYLAKDNMYRSRKRKFSNKKLASDWESSSDGDREYHCNRMHSSGQMKDLPPQDSGMESGWALQYLMLTKMIPRGSGQMDFEGTLIGILLKDPWITFSDEVYDGLNVVTIAGANHGRIFVDPARNYAILGGDAEGTISQNFRYHNSDFVQVIDGIWMPRHLEITSLDKEGWTVSKVMKVNKIACNSGYTKDDFRIKVERGLSMRDLNTGKTVRHPYDKAVGRIRMLYYKMLSGKSKTKATKTNTKGSSGNTKK